jgi:hypothetical protein
MAPRNRVRTGLGPQAASGALIVVAIALLIFTAAEHL